MEGLTQRGPELGPAGLPAQQVSEEGARLQVLAPSLCLVVGEARTPRLPFSRGQKQRGGLRRPGFGGSDGAWESAHTPAPRFLGGGTWLGMGTRCRGPRRALPGAPVRCPHAPKLQTLVSSQVEVTQGSGSPWISEKPPRGQESTGCSLHGVRWKHSDWSNVCLHTT